MALARFRAYSGIVKASKFLATRASIEASQQGRRVIASFGAARLVKNPDGRIELIGGTADDYADAREWCSLFANDVVFTSVDE